MANGNENQNLEMHRSLLLLRGRQDAAGPPDKLVAEWFHLSVAQGSWILRRITSEGLYEEMLGTVVDEGRAISQRFEVLAQLSMSQAAEIIDQSVPAVGDRDAWPNIASRLNAIDYENPGATVAEYTDPDELESEIAVIPMTSLRRLYDFLRMVTRHSTHSAVAKGLSGDPEAFKHICERSRSLFESYANAEGFLAEKRPPLAYTPGMQIRKDRDLAAVLQHFFARPKMVPVRGEECLDFKYVEREVSPFRTTGGIFQNGLPATSSGKGGIDLLLESTDRVPIVGEVKIRNDASAFLALIQACCYAIELSTPNQRQRLHNWLGKCGYSDTLERTDTLVDVYIILYEYPTDEDHAACLRDTMSIARNALDAGLKKWIRRIKFLDVNLDGENGLRFSVRP